MSALATTFTPTQAVVDPGILVASDALLRAELETQRALVDDAEATIRELTGSTGHDHAHERGIADRAMNQALDVIAEIEHALERLSTATYGACESCRAPIPTARLEAIPYARTCVTCPPPAALPRLP
jgi:RNA polymerase-binding transcription factor DksA